ncbi:hypothetical protein [Odoribacter laneus]|nr:hypothetical protein [Odoribacter laneus]
MTDTLLRINPPDLVDETSFLENAKPAIEWKVIASIQKLVVPSILIN